VPASRLTATRRRREGLLHPSLRGVEARRAAEAPLQDLSRRGVPEADRRARTVRRALDARLSGQAGTRGGDAGGAERIAPAATFDVERPRPTCYEGHLSGGPMSMLTKLLRARDARKRGYHPGRPEALWRDLIARHTPRRSFVDVGCMWRVNGEYAFFAADHGATAVTGIDIAAPTSEFLKRNTESGERVRFIRGDVNAPGI